MSDLSFIEKAKLERLLGMSGGYVLDFSNRTFGEFVLETTGKDIFNSKYDYSSGSKANRLRAFWNEEPNYIVGRLLSGLLEYYLGSSPGSDSVSLFEDCERIVQRLQQGAPVPEVDAISPNSGGRDFEILARSVRDAIERNEPEAGLDRLHTFVVRYMRVLCQQRGISTERDKPLHSLVGEYVRLLKQQGLIEAEMTERILKSSISTMEAFNRVRNDQSFAHDNPVLNYDESLLIFNHVSSSIRFIGALEERTSQPVQSEESVAEGDDDFPF